MQPTRDPLALVHIPAKTAAEVALRARCSKEALAHLRPEQSPREFLEALLRDELYRPAIRFLAFALPVRDSVWWGALHLLMSGSGHLHKEDARVLEAVARWVVEPDEAHRLAAEPLVDKETAAGLLARAVAWTGGSLRAPPLPHIPPGPDFPLRGVAQAVTRAVTSGPADKIPERFRQAVALGMHVARGHYSWNQPAHKGAGPSRITGS